MFEYQLIIPSSNNDASSAQTILNPTDVIGHIGDNARVVVQAMVVFFRRSRQFRFLPNWEVQNIDPEDWFRVYCCTKSIVNVIIEGLIFEQDGSFIVVPQMTLMQIYLSTMKMVVGILVTVKLTSTYKQIVLLVRYVLCCCYATQGHKYVLTLGSNVTGITLKSQNNYALKICIMQFLDLILTWKLILFRPWISRWKSWY